MARIRTLKPEFFRSKHLARCSIAARLTFQGLWCEADDYGRGKAEPRVLAGAIWPLDDDIGWQEVEQHLTELAEAGRIRLYEVDGDRYYEIPSWEDHQAAAYRRGKAIHPEPLPQAKEEGLHDEACKKVQDARDCVLELGTGNEERGAGKARKRAAIPTDAFVLTADFTAWAESAVPGLDVERERLSWLDWCAANGKAFRDHEAAFRNWCRKAYAWRAEPVVLKPEPVRPLLGRGLDAAPAWDLDDHGNAVSAAVST